MTDDDILAKIRELRRLSVEHRVVRAELDAANETCKKVRQKFDEIERAAHVLRMDLIWPDGEQGV